MKRSFLYFSGIVIAVIAIIAISVISSYNSLVNLDEARLSSWGDVETAYQRRSDLIPNLVNVVKGAANFEQQTLTQVIEARAKATSVTIKPEQLNEQSMQQFTEAQAQLTSAISRLMVVVEKYPELKATQNFRDLQEQLEGTENRIAYVREQFNKVTKLYNTKLRRVPTVLWVKMFYPKFETHNYFQADEGSKNAPAVNF
jgi:LemA protein